MLKQCLKQLSNVPTLPVIYLEETVVTAKSFESLDSVILEFEPEPMFFAEKSISLTDQVVSEQAGPLASQVPDLTLVVVKDFLRTKPFSPNFDIYDGNTINQILNSLTSIISAISILNRGHLNSEASLTGFKDKMLKEVYHLSKGLSDIF